MAEITRFTHDDIVETHGDMYMYRNLYNGLHELVFPRAEDKVKRGEMMARIEHGGNQAAKLQTPYIIANISKMIVDIPTLFINRSIGKVVTTISEEYEDMAEDERISEMEEDYEVIKENQQKIIDEIVDNSNLTRWHGMNIRQWQIDGGIVAVPEIKNGKPKLSFKERNVYYELDDGVTYQLRYKIERDKKNYVHVHEEVEHENSVEGSHKLYKVSAGNKLELVEDEEVIQEVIGIDRADRTYELKNRNRTLFNYLPYEPSFENQFGKSALSGQETKQDEINWTLTRNAQIFERNGKPRISVTKDVMVQLQNAARQRFNDERKISHKDLEITSIDEKGNSIKIHQIDINAIGNIDYVKDIIKLMLIETQTSEKAVDFFEKANFAESGTAKFYDLFLSIMKSERLRDEYVSFIRQSLEACLWLTNELRPENIIVERPDIAQKEMLPITSQERRYMNNSSYQAGTQSLEQTVRNNNPEKSDAWVERELEELESSTLGQDSTSLLRGNMSLKNFNANEEVDKDEDEEYKRIERG